MAHVPWQRLSLLTQKNIFNSKYKNKGKCLKQLIRKNESKFLLPAYFNIVMFKCIKLRERSGVLYSHYLMLSVFEKDKTIRGWYNSHGYRGF